MIIFINHFSEFSRFPPIVFLFFEISHFFSIFRKEIGNLVATKKFQMVRKKFEKAIETKNW